MNESGAQPPPLQITIEFQYSPEDLYEMVRPANQAEKRALIPPMVKTLFSALVLLVSFGVIFFIGSLDSRFIPVRRSNLWLALGPSYTAALFILLLIVGVSIQTVLARSRAPSRRRQAQLTIRVTMIAAFLLVYIAIRVLASPPFPLLRKWSPTLLLGGALAPWITLLLLFMAWSSQLARRGARRRWKSSPALQRPRKVRIDATGVSVFDSNFSIAYRWSHFRQAWETANLFVLVDESLQRHGFPKRAFSDSELSLFRVMTGSNVPESKFLVRPVGFPISTADAPPPLPVVQI